MVYVAGLLPWQELHSLSWSCGRSGKVSFAPCRYVWDFSITLRSRTKSPRLSGGRLISAWGASCSRFSVLFWIYCSNSSLISSNTGKVSFPTQTCFRKACFLFCSFRLRGFNAQTWRHTSPSECQRINCFLSHAVLFKMPDHANICRQIWTNNAVITILLYSWVLLLVCDMVCLILIVATACFKNRIYTILDSWTEFGKHIKIYLKS